MSDDNQTAESRLEVGIRKLVKVRNLPKFYKEDVDADIRLIKRFVGLEKVLLLRTSGSLLFPLKIGADPSYVSVYTEDKHDHGQVVETYYVDREGNIRLISLKKAEQLASQPPPLPSNRDATEFCEAVTGLIQSSADKRIFGIFETPDIPANEWTKWQQHFSSSGNTVMYEFLARAKKRLEMLKELKPLMLVTGEAA